MAMTAAQQLDSYKFFIIAFGAAPGVVYMDQLNDAYASGMTTKEIVNVYTTKPQFTTLYPNFLTNEQFATSLVNNIVKGTASDAAKTEAVADIQSALASGMTRGDVIYQVFNNLTGLTGDAKWGATADMFNNEIAVAKYYTEVLLGSATDVAILHTVVSGVTPTTDVSSPAAIAAFFADAPAGTFTLTTGQDTIVGTAGADIINVVPFSGTFGSPVSTLQSFDSIDGGAGNDTLNIYTGSGGFFGSVANAQQVGTVKNVETINIHNDNGTFGLYSVDASKFEGATQIWQIDGATNVSSLAATTVAGFRDINYLNVDVTAAATAASVNVVLNNIKNVDLYIDTAATAASVNIGLDNVGATGGESSSPYIEVYGDAVNSVTVAGKLADAVNVQLELDIYAGKNVQTVTVNTAVRTALYVYSDDSGKPVTAVDAGASTGNIEYVADDNAVATVTTGSGDDTVGINTATAKADAANAITAIAAMVSTGAGKDIIDIYTNGNGTTTVNAGDGNDDVYIGQRSTGVLTVNLGAGDDSFSVNTSSCGPVVINGTDVIDGGAGSDTLLLSLIGSANVGAFKNFEVLDAVGLNHALDAELLNANNTVTEFIASGSVVSGASLINVGAGVGVRATEDMGGGAFLQVTQKTAGALTVTLDADSTNTTANNDADLYVHATNATSLKAVFATDSAFVQTSSITNKETIVLFGDKATSLEVVSGGTNATNVLDYTSGDAAGNGLLTSLTITGAQKLDITNLKVAGAGVSQLTTIDASGLTGGLTADLGDLKDGGTIKLGSGVDLLKVSTAGVMESIVGFEKAIATAFGTTPLAAAVADSDTLEFAGSVADANTFTGGTLTNGVLTFTGAGPTTLAGATAIADLAANVAGEALVFNYLADSYVFVQGDTNADTMVKLVGMTGVSQFAETSTADHFIIG